MKKSTVRTEKRPKKFRILRAYSILSYEHLPMGRLFCRNSTSLGFQTDYYSVCQLSSEGFFWKASSFLMSLSAI